MPGQDPTNWVDIIPSLEKLLPEKRIEEKRIWDWSLVLFSQGIDHIIERKSPFGLELLVKYKDKETALQEIIYYERENADLLETSHSFKQEKIGHIEPSLWIFLFLIAFFKLTNLDIKALGYSNIPWYEIGSVQAWAIFHGQWWRLLTGLTLHQDLVHLFSNVFIGGGFIVLLCLEIGSGWGWFLTLLSGGLGNGLNVLIQGVPHNSVGLSTSVFGALGILAALRTVKSPDSNLEQKLLPLGAALGLLALLGTGGKNTDVGAHLSGLGCGFVLGLITKWAKKRNLLLQKRLNQGLGLVTLGGMILIWYLALLQS